LYEEREMMHLVFAKAVKFLISYIKEYKKIISEVKDENFIVIITAETRQFK